MPWASTTSTPRILKAGRTICWPRDVRLQSSSEHCEQERGRRAMEEIVRLGTSARWSDVVMHAGVARWVGGAEDPTQDARGQISQVLRQIDATLSQLGSDWTR